MTPQHQAFWLVGVGLICGLWGLASIGIYTAYAARDPLQDWMVYYGAARASIEGNLPLVLDGGRFTAYLNAHFAGWLNKPFDYRSWAYPPPFLLLLIPFGCLGFVASWAVFEAATFAALLAGLRRAVGSRRVTLHAASLLLAPASWFNLATGQNGFLTTALLLGGFALLPQRPLAAGVLVGLLSYKPQFALLAPVALLAARQWRAMAAAAATSAGIAGVSLAIFGAAPWRQWLTWAISPPADEYRRFLACCRLHDESVFTNLSLLGAGEFAANFGQLTVIIVAAGAVWWSWRRPIAAELRLCVLLAAASLAAPHVANYDAVLLVVAATLLFCYGLEHGFRPGGVIVPVLAWMIQLLNPPDVFPIGFATPVLTMLLILSAGAQAHSTGRLTGGRDRSAIEAPDPRAWKFAGAAQKSPRSEHSAC